jgi:microcystin-dependent protein
MANAKISALTALTGANVDAAADVLAVVDTGVTTTKKILVSELAIGLGLVPGIVVPYAGTSAPTGWLLCYGQTVSQATYPALYAILGTTYGSDGGGNFTLPDLRGRVVAGQDDMGGSSANRLTDQSGGVDGDTLGDTGGAETHALSIAELAAHTHSGGMATGTNTTDGAGATGGASANTGSTGSGTAHNNVQPTIILNYLIKT